MRKFTPPVFIRLLSLISLLVILAGGSAGCSGKAGQMDPQSDLKMATMAEMPSAVQSAPVSVQQAYQFAAANPDVMQHIPCYCGCGAVGHPSNYACYVAGQNADGTLKYDTHALGCSICVDITQDVMRLLRQNKTIQDIRGYIDQTYSKYGPSNMP
jgi:hypothetical protein